MITRLARYIAWFPTNYPKVVMALALVLTAISLAFVPKLEISTDRNLLAGENDPTAKRRDEVNELFGTALAAVVVIAGKDDPEEVHGAADELAASLSGYKTIVRDVFHKADISFFERHAMLFVPPEQLKRLTEAVSKGEMGLETFQQAANLPELVSLWADRAENAALPEDSNPKDVAKALDFFGSVIDELNVWLKGDSDKPLDLVGKLWVDGPTMTGTADSGGYLTDKDSKSPRLAVLFVQPESGSQAMEFVAPLTDLLRQKAAETAAKHPGFKTWVTGMPALTTDEMRVVSYDCLFTGILSGIGVLIIFWLTFRSIRITLFAGLTLGLGIAWATGFAAMVYGHLTMVSAYFAAQLFALGVAYTIYIVSRFHEALTAGQTKTEAVETTIAKAGPGVLGSALTDVAAFCAIAVSEFRAFSELGVIAGIGTLLVLIANITVLPAALQLWHPGRSAVREGTGASAFFTALGRVPFFASIVAIAIFVAGLAAIPKLEFDCAVENLLPGEAESVKGLRLLDERTEFSTTYSVSLAGSLDEAEQKRKKFAALPTVARAEALSMFVPPDQKDRLAVLAALDEQTKESIRKTQAAVIDHEKNFAGRSTAAALAESFQKLEDILEDLAFDAKRANREEAPKLTELVKRVDRARQTIAKMPDDKRVQELERQIFEGLRRGFTVLANGMVDKGFEPKDLPVAIRGRYLSADQKHYAVIVFPKGDIGKRDFFEKHVAEVLSVDPQTTGHPVTHLAFTHLIHRGFAQAAILSAIVTIVLILLDLRRPRDFGLAVLPVIFGAGWVALLMYFADIKFNYANLMAIPILIGTGVDCGINLAHRARQEGSARIAVRTTGKAIMVSGAATLFGFGSLTLAEHWGAKSLGILLTMGIASCLIISLAILPAMFERKKSQ